MALFLNNYCEGNNKQISVDVPDIMSPAFNEYFALASQYSNISSFIFVGEDLSYIKAVYLALGKYQTTKHVYFLEQADPSDIDFVQKKCPKAESLIVAIDKTGKSPEVMKCLLALEHCKLIVCPQGTPLKKLQETHDLAYFPYEKQTFETSNTAVLLPAVLLFINAQEIFEGAEHMFRRCHSNHGDNPALRLARCIAGKNPEIRYFGNRLLGAKILSERLIRSEGSEKIIIPIIAQRPENDIHLSVPYEFHSIPYCEGTLEMLEGASLHQSQVSEFETVCNKTREEKTSLTTITIDAIDPHSIGELLIFWEFVAFYLEHITKD